MTTARTLLAGTAAALLALTAPAASDQSEFVEVAMTVEFGGDSISPVVLLEAGKTADIQFMYDPDYGKAEDPKRMYERAPAELDPRQSHRLLLTVDSAGDNGYIAKTEYMNLPEDKWTSQLLPTMWLRPDSEGSFELEASPGELSRIALTILPRRDIGSSEDARLSNFRTTGQNCHADEAASSSAAGGGGGSSASKSQSSRQPGSSSSWAALSSDCCRIKCGPFTVKCCNACCSDSQDCPGASCCAGRHAGTTPSFPGAP